MDSIILIVGIAFLTGFVAAWIIRTITVFKIKRAFKSSEGFLEQERLINETLKSENKALHQMKESSRYEFDARLRELHNINKRMDEDIILLQRSNEETEELLRAGMPAVHSLKLQLIEAHNTIARFKARLGIKETNETQPG